MKIKYSRSEQEIGLRHKTEHTNDSFKRILASFYRSYSKIWVLNSRKKSLLKTKQKNTQVFFEQPHKKRFECYWKRNISTQKKQYFTLVKNTNEQIKTATGEEGTLAHVKNKTLIHQ